jgi:hydroxyacylglutathione hydrolase
MESKISTHTVVSRLFAENCYIAHLASSSSCVVVDPGLEVERILEIITEQRLHLAAILLTHGHADHIAGVEPLKRCFLDCPIVIGELDADKLTDAELNLSANYGLGFTAPPADRLLKGGETLEYADLPLEVLNAPGHSRGHVVFVYKGEQPWVVFGGDVLFREGVGRTDFPDGDSAQLVESIQTQLFTLPDDTIVLSGHGPPTTIGHEKEFNPFVGRQASSHRFRFV